MEENPAPPKMSKTMQVGGNTQYLTNLNWLAKLWEFLRITSHHQQKTPFNTSGHFFQPLHSLSFFGGEIGYTRIGCLQPTETTTGLLFSRAAYPLGGLLLRALR